MPSQNDFFSFPKNKSAQPRGAQEPQSPAHPALPQAEQELQPGAAERQPELLAAAWEQDAGATQPALGLLELQFAVGAEAGSAAAAPESQAAAAAAGSQAAVMQPEAANV